MIVSGTLTIDPAAHAAATDALAARLTDLDARRHAAEATVGRLLEGWHGEAAATFREEWDAWSSAAASVVDRLATSVAALPRALGDVTEADGAAGGGAVHLRGRLG